MPKADARGRGMRSALRPLWRRVDIALPLLVKVGLPLLVVATALAAAPLDSFILRAAISIAVAAFSFYVFVLRRARRLAQAARLAGAGDLSVRFPEADEPPGRDELHTVARELDAMFRIADARTRELAGAERRYRALVEQIPAIVYISRNDDASTAEYVSPHYEGMLGYTPEERLRDPNLWIKIIHPEDRERVVEEHLEGNRTGRPFRCEYRLIAKDGRVVWVRDEADLMRDEQGERWQGVLLDITERKGAEEEARRLDLQKQSILDAAGEGIWGLGPDGRVTFVNPAAAAMTGWPAEDLMGRSTHELLHHTRADGTPYPREECPIHRTVMGGPSDHVVGELFWRRDGTCFPVEYRATPIHENGRVAGAVVVFSDITARARADDTLREAFEREREAAERLRSVDEMKNAFLSAVSHELRTPLSAVLGYAVTLQQHGDALEKADRTDILDRLAVNARKLQQLLIDLLDLDRMARGILEPQRQLVDVADLVLRVTEESEVAGHQITVDAQHVLAEVDGPKVERIVENLVTNASKYTPADTPVSVSVHREGDGVLIRVDDRGPGIPDELKESMFQPFERGPEAPRHAAGTGIGLSLVERFAQLHGGRAWVEDRQGGGASFRVYLPAALTPPADPGPVAPVRVHAR